MTNNGHDNLPIATPRAGAIAETKWRSAPTRFKQIVVEVAAKHGIKVDLVFSRKRTKKFVACRWEIWARAGAEMRLSGGRIAYYSARDHATVFHANINTSKAAQASPGAPESGDGEQAEAALAETWIRLDEAAASALENIAAKP